MSVNHYSSIKEMGDALRKREVSSVELTQMYLRRLKGIGKDHRVARELTEELALRQAREADNKPPKGPLHGIPFGVKDLLATKGIPTRWGCPGHHDQVFNYDADSVTRLYNAGGVCSASWR